MNQIRNQNQIKRIRGNEQSDKELMVQEDLKKRLEIMKVYTSRNSDSKQLIKNVNDINQKSNNLSLKQITHLVSTSGNNSTLAYQTPFERYKTQTGSVEYQKKIQSQGNIKSKIDLNYKSPGKKINQNQAENQDKYSLYNNMEYQNNNLEVQQQSNQIRVLKSQQYSKKISDIAQGSYNSTSFKLMDQQEMMSPYSLRQNMSGTLKNIIPQEQSQTSQAFRINNNKKVKNLNLSSLKTLSSPNPFQSKQKEIDQLKSSKSISNFPQQDHKNQKMDNTTDMITSHQSTNYFNQISPSSRSGGNFMKENLTTQESNNGDYGSDPIISERGQETNDFFQKRNTLKQLKVNTKKDNYDDETSIYNNSVRFQTEPNEYDKLKKNFFSNINKIMRKQSMIQKSNNENKNLQKSSYNKEKLLTKTEINVFKQRNQGKTIDEMSPKSQINLFHIVKLKSKAKQLHESVSNSFNSSSLENGEDENFSLLSDSVLTEEMDNIELYKKRLKAQQHKFHKLHLKRLTMPQKKKDEDYVPNNFLEFLFNDDSPTKKQKKIKAILEAQKEKAETYNVFGQYNDFSRQLQQKFKETINRLRPSRDIIKYVEIESKKIHHKITTMNAEKNIEMHKQSYRNLAETTINVIQKMIPIFEEGTRQVYDRNALDDVLNRIYQESLKTKNLVVQILCAKASAKIAKLNKNYSKSIDIYKQCKSCAEIPMLFNYRLSCYKNLGYCFSHLKMYDFAMFYFCKMLRIAWYQNNHDAELKAYDLIGMQYYYQGKLEIAQYYHNKMIQGIYEKEDSDIRRLGISKIDNRLRQIEDGANFGDARGPASSNIIGQKANLQKSNKLKQMRQDPDQSCEFNISSESEEDFELPIPAKSYHEQTLKDNPNESHSIMKTEEIEDAQDNDSELEDSREIDRNNLLKLSQKQRKFKKNQPLFYHKDTHQLKQITEQANKNIHIGAIERERKQIILVPKKNINASSFKQIKGSTKISYRINHLSVNRELDNYQCIDGRVTKLKHFNFNDQMYDQYEKPVKQKIKNIFENLRDNLLFAMAQLEMQIQKQKSPTKRKGGFIINPQYGLGEINVLNKNSLQNNYTITLTKQN